MAVWVSYKSDPNGTKSPYELNVNYLDALSLDGEESDDQGQIQRFLVAHAIIFSIIGVPAIYFHSLFGSHGWPAGVKLTGQNRTINRQKLDFETLEIELLDARSRRYQIYCSLRQMIRARAGAKAFDPYGRQIIFDFGDQIFALLRVTQDKKENVFCIHNVSGEAQQISLDKMDQTDWTFSETIEIISGKPFDVDVKHGIHLAPYQVLWLKHA